MNKNLLCKIVYLTNKLHNLQIRNSSLKTRISACDIVNKQSLHQKLLPNYQFFKTKCQDIPYLHLRKFSHKINCVS